MIWHALVQVDEFYAADVESWLLSKEEMKQLGRVGFYEPGTEDVVADTRGLVGWCKVRVVSNHC